MMFDDNIKQLRLSEPPVLLESNISYQSFDKYKTQSQEGLSDTEYGCALYESVVRLCMRLLWLTVNRSTTITPRTVPLLKILQCNIVSLTSCLQVCHLGTVSLQKCFCEYQCIRMLTSENALEKPLDIRKLDNSSYQALGACFKPYKAFLKR
ncbi:hypothetical protein Tco_1406671 [Tanacetum coccineum]